MQTILASYDSRSAAEAAVRNLECQGLSIQNLVVADQAQRVWRALRPSSGSRPHGEGFVVYTLDEDPDVIDRARALMAARPSQPLAPS